MVTKLAMVVELGLIQFLKVYLVCSAFRCIFKIILFCLSLVLYFSANAVCLVLKCYVTFETLIFLLFDHSLPHTGKPALSAIKVHAEFSSKIFFGVDPWLIKISHLQEEHAVGFGSGHSV